MKVKMQSCTINRELICPHCLVAFHPYFQKSTLKAGNREQVVMYYGVCPDCNQYILYYKFEPYTEFSRSSVSTTGDPEQLEATLVYPRQKSRKALSGHIPTSYIKDFQEAVDVLPVSLKASAALSRRLLQRLLEAVGNITKDDLAKEIQQVLDSEQLPTHIAEILDAVRNIGNFSTHPLKSQRTGEIVDVEPGEAEWNLEVLEALLDFYFVQPARTKERKDNLNKKLNDLGKPNMK
jgi:hypothetical protein